MKISFFVAMIVFQFSHADADAITDLRSPDINVRRAAISRIQTKDDSRIPAACLPLLKDSGFSIQRLAARAIGSRFDQIAPNDRPRYLAALRACIEKRKTQPVLGTYDDTDDITLMCQRASGLISKKYDSPPFSVSPDGKWVLYERRRRPVVADIATQRHHILAPIYPDGSWNDDAYYSEDEDGSVETNILKTVDTNLSAKNLFAPHWRPDSDALALTFERLQGRFYHPIMIWTASAPADVKVLDEAYFQSLLGKSYPQWGTTTEFAGWRGTKVLVKVYNCAYPEGGHPPDPGLVVSYNVDGGKIALEK